MLTNFDSQSAPTTKQPEGWRPLTPETVKQANLRKDLHDNGYAIIDFADATMVDNLRAVYHQNHQLEHEDGGMFYSVYSRDVAYRKRVHQQIGDIIQPRLQAFFSAYRNLLNGFVVKASGAKSGFMIHQDSTALDEFKYTALTVWIALQDTDSQNGCINLVPKSHLLASPYRAITIPEPYKSIEQIVAEYLQPIHLKAGQALVFDQRIIHNSSVNNSGQDRLAIISGIFPEEAQLTTCYSPPNEPGFIELHRHSDEYLLENPKFFHDCHDRPEGSEVIDKLRFDFPEIEEAAFLDFCKKHHIEKGCVKTHSRDIEFISEPRAEVTNSYGLVERIKSLFR